MWAPILCRNSVMPSTITSEDRFYAAAPAEEKRCYDLELNVLESIEDVTGRVNAAVAPGSKPQAASNRGVVNKSSIERLSSSNMQRMF